MDFKLTQEELNKILAYLGKRPWAEVNELITIISNAPTIQFKSVEEEVVTEEIIKPVE